MMKRSMLALAVALSIVPTLSNAAEIYNKDGNKLDLYGRVAAKYLSQTIITQTILMSVLVLKGKHKSIAN